MRALIDFLKALLPALPVVTFIAGYLLSNLDRLRESRRKVRNMKVILFKELSENYRFLNMVVPHDERQVPSPRLVAMLSQRMSSAVYDRYLDRLDQLSTEELGGIFDTYTMIKALMDEGKVLLALPPGSVGTEVRDRWAAQATMVVTTARTSYERAQSVIAILPAGPAYLRAQEGDRGSALAKEREVEALLQSQGDAES